MALPMLRSLTGQTEIEPRHLSVNDAELLDLKIKGSRVVWFTSVKSFGDEQIRNRFIYVNPDESPEQDERVFELQKKPEIEVDEIKDFKVAQALTKKILEETRDLKVVIPYIDRIIWPYKDKRWLFPIFKAFLEVITKIHYKQRKIVRDSIFSTYEDFATTKKLWGACLEHIIYRVSKPVKKVLDILPEEEEYAITKAEIAGEIGYTTTHTGRLLEELEEAELINSKKQEHGRVWVFWKAKMPSIEDIKIQEELVKIT